MCAGEVMQAGAVMEELGDDFYMYRAKVEMCPRKDIHPHSSCPYLHPNEPARRRDPLLFKYDSIFCYDLHNTKVCKRGANCPYSHNLQEYFLHPSRYRTRMCEYGENCKRELCFFAHNESQLRERKAVKTYSGGRRSGKHKMAAAAAAANAASDFSTAAGVSSSPTACGSPSVCLLQVPSLPGASVSSSSSGAIQGFDFSSPAVFSQLSLGPGGAADPTAQQGAFSGSPLAPHMQSTAVPMGLQQQQQPTSPLLIIQGGSEGGSAERLSALSYDPSGLGSSMQGMPVYGSIQGGQQQLLPVGYMDMQQTSLPPLPCSQGAAQAAAYPSWSAAMPLQQPGVAAGVQHHMMQTQQLAVLQPQAQLQPQQQQQVQVLQAGVQGGASSCILSAAALPCDTTTTGHPGLLQVVNGSTGGGVVGGGQYVLVSMGSGATASTTTGLPVWQQQLQLQHQQQQHGPLNMLQVVPTGHMMYPGLSAAMPEQQPAVLLVNTMQQQQQGL